MRAETATPFRVRHSPAPFHPQTQPGVGALLFNDLQHDDPLPTYVALPQAIAGRRLAYLHVMRVGIGAEDVLREVYPRRLLVGGGFLKEEANRTLEAGRADAIVFGSLYVSNPDLVQRFECNAPLNTPDASTYYTPGPKGYTDYPVLDLHA